MPKQDETQHVDKRAEILDIEANPVTLRAVYDRVSTARAALLQQAYQMEKIMDWLLRKRTS